MGNFETTRWSVVLAARGTDSAARDALDHLCQTYWPPLYAFVRRQGHGVEQAQDLTQDFFARFIGDGFLDTVHPDRGRFRTFLLACVKHFLSHEREREHARKREGNWDRVTLDLAGAEDRVAPALVGLDTPERAFERQWALALLDQVMAALEREYGAKGRGELFRALKGGLLGGTPPEAYREIAERLDISEGAVKTAVYRLRKRYRELLHEEVARTVDTPEDVEVELRDLFAALR